MCFKEPHQGLFRAEKAGDPGKQPQPHQLNGRIIGEFAYKIQEESSGPLHQQPFFRRASGGANNNHALGGHAPRQIEEK